MSSHPIAADVPVVYAASWCPYCVRLLKGLKKLGVEHLVVDVEGTDGEAASRWVESVNDGNRIVPTVAYPDGSHATNPPAADVAAHMAP